MVLLGTMTCDVCGDSISFPVNTLDADEVRRGLAKIGWTERDDAFQDVCPRHTKESPSHA
jgi:hypothetical protein